MYIRTLNLISIEKNIPKPELNYFLDLKLNSIGMP